MDNLPASNKPVTVEEIAAMESHAELIDGIPVVINVTSVPHNIAVQKIAAALERFIAANNDRSEVFTQNVALYCNELCDKKNNFFLPDVMVVSDETGIKDDGVHVAPKFVAEVTSEETKAADYTDKMFVYGEIGVEEYWVVDLQRKLVVRYLRENEFIPEFIFPEDTYLLSVVSYPGLSIDLKRIFKDTDYTAKE